MIKNTSIAATQIMLALALTSAVCADTPFGEGSISKSFSEDLRQAFEEPLSRKAIPGGSLLLIRKGDAIFNEGFGYADTESERPFETSEICKIASLSKPVIGMIVARLVAEGKIDPAKPIDFYLPKWRDAKLKDGSAPQRLPTVYDLVTHSAGLSEDKPYEEDWSDGLSLEEVVDLFPSRGFLIQNPGEEHVYSALNVEVAARIAEVVTGKYLEKILQDEIVKPLGLQSMTYVPSSRVLEKMPDYHMGDKSGNWSISPGTRSRKNSGNYAERDYKEYYSSGGGIVCSAEDYAIFASVYLNEGKHDGETLIARAVWKDFMKNRLGGEESPYFLFWGVSYDSDGDIRLLRHSGSSGTSAWADFNNDVIAVMFTQYGQEGRVERNLMSKRLQDSVSEHLN